ncbi:dTDP-4-dehydrorhamnose reductase [Bacillus salacetis]|uniref:dTDP-4-dehydrorhamnose reductase n=1 Tax=Bacillus salacetis TaxID=2315464 RepID=A0A3A1QV97_9BACI|nr:dTDP-4-dehydrorhamnose reductase [Bacillus salacetis]RIW29348.1 dTDP-4-dehydrorhamnose reductase [Bacillus salacetis]
MKIAITGAGGQLGTDLAEFLTKKGHTVIPYLKSECDVTQLQAIRKALDRDRPDTVLNAAAFAKVDVCESEQEKAYSINTAAPCYLALETKRLNMKFIHFSTDYVFSGKRSTPYEENDEARPGTVYGKSKLLGEYFVSSINPDATIIRTSWLFGHTGRNFVKTIRDLARGRESIQVVSDQFGSPAYTCDLAACTEKLLYCPPGIYHVSNSGSCSWHDFASEVVRLLNEECTVIPVTSQEYGSTVPRPAYSVLSHKKINEKGIFMRNWKEALHEYLTKEGDRNED